MMRALVAELSGPVYSVHMDIQFVLRNLQISQIPRLCATFPDCAEHM